MNIESEKSRVQAFVDKGNYHAAINIALSAMNECRITTVSVWHGSISGYY